EAFGIDISEYAISKVREDIQPYCKVASIAEPLEDEFDLIVTIETFEHLPHKEVIIAIGNLVHASEDIIFSSSPADFVEATHQNVQPPEYWALNFAQYGYFRDVDYDSTFITDWTVRFRKGRDPLSRIVADYERMLWRLVQQSRSERELILQQRQLLSNSASALEMLQNKMKSIVSDVNHHSTEALVSQLEELMGKIDELDLTKDKGRQSDSVPDL
ncbi:MAG: methyltransferase domain-containing protein, partial [Candidatus Hermodarchaeia archaeon]